MPFRHSGKRGKRCTRSTRGQQGTPSLPYASYASYSTPSTYSTFAIYLSREGTMTLCAAPCGIELSACNLINGDEVHEDCRCFYRDCRKPLLTVLDWTRHHQMKRGVGGVARIRLGRPRPPPTTRQTPREGQTKTAPRGGPSDQAREDLAGL
jgi:hypothetical protein